MIDRIIETSLRQRAFVIFAALGLTGAGIWAALHLPIDAVPDITNVQVQLNTEVPALAPEEIEKLVTLPLEIELSGIQGVDEFRSLSRFGLSQVTLVFKDGTDIYRARQLVSERLANVQLPAGLKPVLSPIATGLGEIVYYTLDYKKDAQDKPTTRIEQLMELRETQEFVVKPFLRSIPGVADINTNGGYERQIVVMPKSQALRDAAITFSELAEVIAQNAENSGGGVVERGSDLVLMRGVSKVSNIEEIGNLPVKFGGGVKPILVRDLAEIGIGSDVRIGAAAENGQEAVLGTVIMLFRENSRTVSLRVEEKIAALQDKLPPNMEARVKYTRSSVVDRTIATVKTNLFEGAILVAVVLFLLLGNWRGALIVTMAIPLSFFFALIGMAYGGVSGNLMSLGAIDFGLIIDGAVVMVENVVRVLGIRQKEMQRKLTSRERLEAVREAASQVGRPMFFGVLIITIVYVPILALTGTEGKLFHPMAITVMMALGGSLVLALTLMPALCSLLLRGKIREGDNFLMRAARFFYVRALKWSWNLRWIVIPGAAAFCALAFIVFRHLPQEFVPTLDEGSVTMMSYQPASTNLTTSLDRTLRTQRFLIEKVPEITSTFARIGTSKIADDPMPPAEYDLYFFYKPREQWRRENGQPVSKRRLVELILEDLNKEVPGQTWLVAQPIEMRFNEMLEGLRSDVAVKIFGEDYDVMEKLGEEIKTVLENVDGTDEVEFETQGRVPVLEMRLNRNALENFNVEAAEVNAAIATALAGRVTGMLIEQNRRREIVVRLPESERGRQGEIKSLPVRTRDGNLVMLGQVADFVEIQQVDVISRENARRRVGLMVNLEGRDATSYVHEAEAKIVQEVKVPARYRVEFGGQFENLREVSARLAIVVPAALVLIFFLIYMAFGSLRQTLIVYTGIPLAVTGGIFALWVRDMSFSITAAVGFIALSGVAVLNGVVMISFINKLRSDGLSVDAAVIEGSLTRLRPVLMTALVAAVGFLPMAISTGPGAEVQRPLATVVIGGILSSTALTLLVLPALCRMFQRRNRERDVITEASLEKESATSSFSKLR